MHRFSITTVAMLVANGLACDCFAGERRTADHAPPELAEPVRADADVDELMRLFREKNDAGTLFVTRDKWPRDVPLRVMVRPPRDRSSLLRTGHNIFLLDCHGDVFAGMTVASYGIIGPGRRGGAIWRDDTQGISATCIDNDGNIEFTVSVRGSSRDNVRPTVSERMSFAVGLVDSVDEILEAVPDEQVTDHLAANLSVTLISRRFPDDELPTLILRLPLDLPSDMTVALKAEIVAGEEELILGTGRFTTNRRYRVSLPQWEARGERLVFLELDCDLPGAEVMQKAEQQGVRARFTSDPEFALRDFENTRYWHGSFTTDVTVSGWDD